MNLKVRLAIMNFLEFAAWGAYLTSMGTYLTNIGMASQIGWFYAIQGVVSIFMPALAGIVADRWIPAQRMLGVCHLLAGLCMFAAAYAEVSGNADYIFPLYSLSVAFYMPTLALSNSVAYYGLTKAGMDTVKDFPPIRVFGTIGFICMMWFVDLKGFQPNQNQFVASGVVSLLLFLYTFSLPHCPISKDTDKKSMVDAFGLRAFALFKQKKMAIFFIFSMLLGVSLQITNGFANPFITSFKDIPEYSDTFGVQHANILISLSQISETCCILLIPFFMKRFGIKNVMLIAMFAWVLRFGLFGAGNPGSGVWMFVLSMLVYGVAFDFFNISGSLFVDQSTDPSLRSSAQGLFMLMTNGIGATVGTLSAQAVVNDRTVNGVTDWQSCWFIFAGYALVVCLSFGLMFRPKKKTNESKVTL
ncbi:MFS transporter [Prevotella sp. A2931]|uniref:MFS transporter n=1 Tax=Prevotella illustrans TaxID=2800387 RepID=A0ABS3M2L7_9BACT|nr:MULTISPECIES: nucleoside permease [Prevotella]MBO1362432.1 MFS transporter [Prevotella illustrans]PTL25054.1 MFS transporter [Prevotella sp. oral taxon 820]